MLTKVAYNSFIYTIQLRASPPGQRNIINNIKYFLNIKMCT